MRIEGRKDGEHWRCKTVFTLALNSLHVLKYFAIIINIIITFDLGIISNLAISN
jgi:hypothetical protein